MKLCKDCEYFKVDTKRKYPSHLIVYRCEKYNHTAPIEIGKEKEILKDLECSSK